jgi:hypothetical protein
MRRSRAWSRRLNTKKETVMLRLDSDSHGLNRRLGLGAALTLALCAAGAAPAGAQAGPPAFLPPDVGAPVTRVAAATRGLGAKAEVWALVPPQAGLTSKASPALFWCLTESFDGPIELTVQVDDRNAREPLLATRLENGAEAGLHSLALPAGKELAPGQEYQWSVALVVDEKNRSADIFAGGAIRREAGLKPENYWYDLVEQTSADSAVLAQFLENAQLSRDARCVRGQG